MTEKTKEVEDFTKALDQIKEIMDKNNLGFIIQHQVLIVPKEKPNEKQD